MRNLFKWVKISQLSANVATVIFLFFAGYQGYIATEALKNSKDSEVEAYNKSRKEFGINTLLNFSNNSEKNDTGLSCILLMADMSNNEFSKILNYQVLDISSPHIDKLTSCIAGQKEKDLFDRQNKQLTKLGSYYGRYKFLNTMNTLETYAIAGCYDLINNDMLDMILGNLRMNNYKTAIDKIREATGNQAYGYLYEYIAHEDNRCGQLKKSI